MAPYMSIDEVLEVARHGAAMGCKEALFTLGEKPELRYKAAREALAEMGYESTTDYLFAAAQGRVRRNRHVAHRKSGQFGAGGTGAPQNGIAFHGHHAESASERLCEKGMPHYGSPDKIPAVELQTLANAGIAQVPFTTGILIGIGETRLERIESLLAIAQDSRTVRSRTRNHRAELSRQSGNQNGKCAGTGSERVALDDCCCPA